jgi:hypothetical protein
MRQKKLHGMPGNRSNDTNKPRRRDVVEFHEKGRLGRLGILGVLARLNSL